MKSVGSVLVAFLLGLPAVAHAQGMMGQSSMGSIEAHGGLAIPTGSLSKFEKVGPTAGISFQYRIVPRVAVRAQGDLELLQGDSLVLVSPTDPQQTAPDLNLWHYGVGAAIELTNPEATESPWEVLFNVGVGATTMKSKDFAQPVDNMTRFSKTYFTPNWGLTVGYDVTSSVNIFAGGQGYLIMAKKDDTGVFETLTAGQTPAFGTQFSAPVYAGFRVRF